MENKLIHEISDVKNHFDNLMAKLIKDIKRQEKIMVRADKRQKEEYDALQQKLQEVQELQQLQKNLMDSFIKIIAGAIDAKSAYTGGHCERVPEIAIMLAQEASKDNNIDFKIENKEQEREISIAAWLHDCGKVVTPEYVVDKATKLETIYNRIHEIRTRFEILHRDLTIKAFEKKLNGENSDEVDKWLQKSIKNYKRNLNLLPKVM
jgi:HD-GYP domain-containing protein (c-di-GMP phosphodiesterase class II)